VETKRLKYAVKLRSEAGQYTSDDTFIGMENVESATSKYVETEAQSQYQEGFYSVVRKGDVLFGKLRPYLAKAMICDFDGFSTNEFLAFSEFSGDKRFLLYLLLSDGFVKLVDSSTYGTKMPRASWDFIRNVRVPVPSLKEQTTIAVYLDRRTAEIDSLLADLQAQAEMLDRYKRELIADAVTHGLDKSAPRKDSGADWIGEIPADWKLKRIASLYSERSTKVSDIDYPALSVTKNGIVPQLESVAFTNHGDNRKLVKAGDFVINSRSDRRGSCGISPLDGSVTLISIVLKPNRDIYNPYYNYVFRSVAFADEFYKWGYGIVNDLWSTKWSSMKVINIQNPPIEEQEQIAAYLDSKTAQIDNLIADIGAQIEKLKQYRKLVIHDAVTGKIKITEG
jgi:type I restriction enzyme S subunit